MEAGGWWAVAGAIVLGITVATLAVRAALRKDRGNPPFAPDRKLLVAGGLLAALAASTVIARPFVAPVPISTLLGGAAFIVVGASVRPRGSRARGALLGLEIYLATGIAVLPIAAALIGVGVADASGLLVLQSPFWPDVLAATLIGAYTIG